MKLIGLIGLLCVQGCHLFQLLEMRRLKRMGLTVRGVSPAFYYCLGFGLLMFLIYSIGIRDLIYIVSNIVGLTQVGVAIWMLRRG